MASPVLKRLEEIEANLAAGQQPPHHTTFLLKLTRALLESQGELLARSGDNHDDDCAYLVAEWNDCSCGLFALIHRAERLQKGEV